MGEPGWARSHSRLDLATDRIVRSASLRVCEDFHVFFCYQRLVLCVSRETMTYSEWQILDEDYYYNSPGYCEFITRKEQEVTVSESAISTEEGPCSALSPIGLR